jgi:hypothetical protein
MLSNFSTQFLISLRLILKLSASLLITSSTYATTYFQDCKTALAEPSFHVLKEYLDSVGNQLVEGYDESDPDKCFRMNNNEFGVLTYEGVFYCDLQHSNVCENSMPDSPFVEQNLVVSDEFDGDVGKHFVLLHSAAESNGIYGLDYGLLFLDSKRTVGADPLRLKRVVEASGDEETCATNPTISTFLTNFRKPEYQIVHAGQKNVSVVFNLVKENCKTHRKTDFQQRFVLRHGEFVEVHGNQ